MIEMYFFANITNETIEKKKKGFFLRYDSIIVKMSFFTVILYNFEEF